jgi:transcriptional regulator with XRE-family HTH domain
MTQELIGKTIQERREKLSLTQEDLAEMTGISSRTLYAIENGRANPSLTTLQKILEVVGLELFIDIKKISE